MELVETCDLCGASLAGARCVPGLEEAPLVECASCGLVSTSPRPTPDELPAFYPDTYYAHVPQVPGRWQRLFGKLKQYRGGYPSDDTAPMRLAWRIAAALLGGTFLTCLPYRGPGRRLLDIGCGSGRSLLWAKERGWDAYGVEWSAAAVALAHRSGLDQVRAGTVEEQGFPPESFDAITIYQVLEHVYSPSSVLHECSRILRSDGTLYVSVPNFDSYPRWLLGEVWYGMRIPIHFHHFTATTLGRQLEKAGFEVVTVRDYSAAVTTYSTLMGLRERLRPFAHRGGGALLAEARAMATRLRRARRQPEVKFTDMMLLEARLRS